MRPFWDPDIPGQTWRHGEWSLTIDNGAQLWRTENRICKLVDEHDGRNEWLAKRWARNAIESRSVVERGGEAGARGVRQEAGLPRGQEQKPLAGGGVKSAPVVSAWGV